MFELRHRWVEMCTVSSNNNNDKWSILLCIDHCCHCKLRLRFSNMIMIYRFILSKMGKIISNVGRLPASSFMQMLINLEKYDDVPGGTFKRRPSVAIRMPHSIGDKSANGISRVLNSHMHTAKLHISHASQFRSLRFFCSASGDIHAGWYRRPRSWNENFASPMLMRAVKSSSIYSKISNEKSNILLSARREWMVGGEEKFSTHHNMIAVQMIFRYDAFQRMQEGHAPCDIQCKSNRLCGVHNNTSRTVK